MRILRHDIVIALRALRRRPAFVAAVVLTLALGIGANTAIFSLVDAVLLNPLPSIARADEVVAIYRAYDAHSIVGGVAYPEFRLLSRSAQSLNGLAGYCTLHVAANLKGEPRQLSATAVSGSYFALLGLRPQAGRLIAPSDDDVPGAHAVVVLSDGLWTTAFGRERSAIGSTIRIGERPFTIVGVAPAGFHGTELASSPQLWVPLTMAASLDAGGMLGLFGRNLYAIPIIGWVQLVGRLRDSVTVAGAAAELNTLGGNADRDLPTGATVMNGPGRAAKRAISVVPIAQAATISDRGTLVRFVAILLAVVALTLLIACVNVANLMLVRSNERARELGVRAALGASRSRLAWELFLESLLLATFGAAVGIVVGVMTIRMLTAFTLPGHIDIAQVGLGLNGRVLAFTVVLAMATAVLFGLLPAIRASRPDLASLFKGVSSAARLAPRGVLVAGQVAMSLVLLVGAALFVRSLRAGLTTDLGFDSRPLAAITMDPLLVGYDQRRAARYYDDVMDRARRIPGVRAVAVAASVPLANVVARAMSGVAGSGADTSIFAVPNAVSPGYFRMLSVPLVAGRLFTTADDNRAAHAVIVNETAARLLSPDAPIIGRQIRLYGLVSVTVIGVVGDTKYQSVHDEHVPAVFLPIAQQNPLSIASIVISSDDPKATLPALRRAVASVDANVPLRDARLVADQIDIALMPQRFGATLLGLFALVSLCVSAVGIYGVVAFAVSQRSTELAVRVALGAQDSAIIRVVVGATAVAVAAGSVVGIAGAVVASRALAGFLYGVTPLDAVAFIGATMLLALAAAVASAIPALRAARVDPMGALRGE